MLIRKLKKKRKLKEVILVESEIAVLTLKFKRIHLKISETQKEANVFLLLNNNSDCLIMAQSVFAETTNEIYSRKAL